MDNPRKGRNDFDELVPRARLVIIRGREFTRFEGAHDDSSSHTFSASAGLGLDWAWTGARGGSTIRVEYVGQWSVEREIMTKRLASL
jgi:hypothetical protein